MSEIKKVGPDWLRDCGEWVEHGEKVFLYSLAKMRDKFEVRELPGGWLVLENQEVSPGFSWLRFAAARFGESEVGGANELDALVFHGDGPSGYLRECRHTYWGEDGYIFYPDGRLITAAFRELAEFFDDMAAEP